MSEVTEEVIPQVDPEVTTPEVKEEDKPQAKVRRVIQPKDKDGNPVGAPHVYEGETEQEVTDKMADAIANGTLKIRELTRKSVLEGDASPDKFKDAEKVVPLPVYAPKQLTAEQKFAISQKFRDPEKVEEAWDEMYEAKFGRKPAEAAKDQSQTYDNARMVREQAETTAFLEATPDYVRSEKNKQVIFSLMAKYKLAWNKTNIDLTYKEALSEGLLDVATERNAQTDPEPPRTEVPVEQPAKRTPSAFPSALGRNDASGSGAPPKKKTPTAAEIAMAGPDEIKAWQDAGLIK
jgi:hypothetical protein